MSCVLCAWRDALPQPIRGQVVVHGLSLCWLHGGEVADRVKAGESVGKIIGEAREA